MSTGHEFILDNEGHEGIVKSEKKRKLGESTFDFYVRIDCTNNVSKSLEDVIKIMLVSKRTRKTCQRRVHP
jgi:hypothetical protein